MNIEQLHALHFNKLAQSFQPPHPQQGVSTALAAFRDDRAARAFGDHYAQNADPATSKREF